MLLRFDRPVRIIDRFAKDVEDAAQGSRAHRHLNRVSLVGRLHAALHAVGGLHGDGADAVLAEMLLDFDDDIEVGGAALALRHDAQRVVDVGQVTGLELDVHHWPDDLHDCADVLICHA